MSNAESKFRVRFAPSPTGYLHVGGARTAIFNWVYARKHHGEFLIRIEDTDLERSDPAMVENIINSLSWLGLNADKEIVYQSQNAEAHRDAVQKLLQSDSAYRCFCDPEDLEKKRQTAVDEESYHYDGTCRNLSDEEIQQHLDNGDSYAVRFWVKQNGPVRFKDRVYKKISVETSEIDDFVIQRRDGSPVYQLAVVVDDAQMGITHVIRGEDHLSNTPKQILLYLALGYDVPKFAHLPLIVGQDGKRLSKRHGATSLEEYHKRGYLNSAMLNYLALLGWTPKSNQEIFMPDELVEEFDLLRVSKKSAAFDEQKLEWVSAQHFKRWTPEDLFPLVAPLLEEAGLLSTPEDQHDYIIKVIELLQSKVRRLAEFVEYGGYFWQEPTEYESGAVEKYWSDENVTHLMEKWLQRLAEITVNSASRYEEELRTLAEEEDIKAAELIHPTRLALTGSAVSPGLFEVMELLGQDTVVRRVRKAVEYFGRCRCLCGDIPS